MNTAACTQPTILVVDDHPNMLRLLCKVLRPDGRVLTASSGDEAIQVLQRESVDVVLADLRMPGTDGLAVLRACRQLRPRTQFILMTAYASVPTAVEALRLGAFDYLTKPVDPELARTTVMRAIGRVAQPTDAAPASGELLPGLLGASAPMTELTALVRKFAASEATVLLLGETGTGKELVARATHRLSGRASGPFVPINCAALPAELLESELFGFARGTFTGAARERPGLFEEATGGTLFLDEIGEMPTVLQAKLTRALEERAIRRLGEARERPVNVRLVAATHRDLEAMVEAGDFRADLWYRLNVAVVRIPPLRERAGDIELLASRFLKASGGTRSEQLVGFTRAALDALQRYGWPGNVRQLRSAIDRACAVASASRIDLGDLPAEVCGAFGPSEQDIADQTWSEVLEATRAATARRYLQAVLDRHDGRVADAAVHAGIERESFYRLMRKYGVAAPISDSGSPHTPRGRNSGG